MTLNHHKNRNYVIIASLKSETMDKLIIEYQFHVFCDEVYQALLWEGLLNRSAMNSHQFFLPHQNLAKSQHLSSGTKYSKPL